MISFRTYGSAPYSAAVVHGGPGACGEMAPVARRLSSFCGVLEPIQNALSVNGQVDELKSVLEENAVPPVVLIGHSWGAWLCFILAARHPSLAGKLILVSSPPFEEKYTAEITQTRRARLSADENREFDSIIKRLEKFRIGNHTRLLGRLGTLTSRTDVFSPEPCEPEPGDGLPFRSDIYKAVWKEASEMRASGRLIELARRITCPVLAVHGSYDPHPPDGVRLPLLGTIKDFRFILLNHCGHRPWIERRAKDEFFSILQREIEEHTKPQSRKRKNGTRITADGADGHG
jgi:pimeloyl-ACP methyl ester carboxylesterase